MLRWIATITFYCQDYRCDSADDAINKTSKFVFNIIIGKYDNVVKLIHKNHNLNTLQPYNLPLETKGIKGEGFEMRVENLS